ncbi:MAG: LysE family translocator [Chloroflexota bacterium]
MIPNTQLLLFVFSSAVLLVTPGPAVLYIIARSIDHGRLAGFVSVISIETGNLFHAITASFGISALLLSYPFIFLSIKYVGAVYLGYMGTTRLFSEKKIIYKDNHQVEKLDFGNIYKQGLTVAIFNPKTALFFLAFLPQFVDHTQSHLSRQLLVLGLLFVLMALISDGMYAFIASRARKWLIGNQRVWFFERYVVGIIYIVLGVIAAFQGNI